MAAVAVEVAVADTAAVAAVEAAAADTAAAVEAAVADTAAAEAAVAVGVTIKIIKFFLISDFQILFIYLERIFFVMDFTDFLPLIARINMNEISQANTSYFYF